ncbi:MAG: alpha/beta hydrolase-fold protein [Bacteroidota bacterium]|nr:alpha/beta hydrolase-fold protein [Bacteroidota bacterium]
MKFIFSLCLLICSHIQIYCQKSAPDGSRPFVLGITNEIHSAILNENRTLNIYLPDGYDPKDTSRYPVIYLLDGAADEDFIHVAGLVQFNTFPWIDRIPKCILVGIANTERQRDFTHPTRIESDKKQYPSTGHSEKFIAFIEKELQPYIESHFQATTERTLIGQSLGGLLATEIVLKRPELFSKYIIISPSLWWDDASLLSLKSVMLNQEFDHRTDIYIGVGKEGLGPGVIPHVMEVDANLLAEKLKNSKSQSVTVHFDYLPEEDHATIAHQAILNAMKVLYR